jgi:AraC-like DNA-binding protein
MVGLKAVTVKPRNHQVYLPPATERLGVTCSSVGVESAGYGLSIVAADQQTESDNPSSRFDGALRVTSDWFLAYMITGSGQLLIDNGCHDIGQGSVVCLPPESGFRVEIDREHPYCIYYVTFGGQSMRERKVCTAIDELTPTAEIGLCRDVIRMFRDLLETGVSRTVDAQRELGASIVLLVAKLVNRLHDRRSAEHRPTAVDRAKAIMAAHIFDHISVGEIAREVGVPKSTFRRTFRSNAGISPYHYFIERKIEAAKNDLLMDATPLRAIAEKYCFTDQYHFSRVFSRVTGCRPTEWRRQHQRL